jgi:precorrin-3B C17-methyltransferase
VVGIGPGDPDLLCPRALSALRRVAAVIGYAPYCDQLETLCLGIPLERWPIGSEVDRARLAARRAREGERIAVVSSGDAGVYGMASLVLDALYDEGWDGERNPAVEVVPGITAALAAAARLGAPLGVDFACLSLSDLLVPWELIERRLEAAAIADLCVVLYNPRSRGRPEVLDRALAVLRRHRDPSTPAAAVHDVCRPGERIELAEMATLDTAAVDMTTLVVIGCSMTRRRGRHLITARRQEGQSGPPRRTGSARWRTFHVASR